MHVRFGAAQPAERSAGSAGRAQRRRVHSPPSFFFLPLYFFFSYSSMFSPPGGHACGQAMPHCRELALAQVWGLIHHRAPDASAASDARRFPADQSAEPTPTFPALPSSPRPPAPTLHSPLGELPLRCKVTDAFPHAIKKKGKRKGPSQC